MRVLHLYAGNLYGGIETLLVTLARHRGLWPDMEPHFGLCFEGRLSRELKETGAPVHMLGETRFSRPWTVWRARRNLASLLATDGPDVVICHECWPHALFAPVVRAERLPLVFWTHGVHCGRHWLERWASQKRPNLVIANSKFTESTLGTLFPGIPNQLLYLPVSAPPLMDWVRVRQELRQEFHTPSNATVILIASRMESLKGHHILIQALGRLLNLPNWMCWIAGRVQRPSEERYLADLQAEVNSLGLSDNFRFLGERPDVPQLLTASDIHCQPNTGPESFGIAFVEALYAGLPVVTTAIGGALEIIDDSCGVLVPPGNVDALAATLSRLIEDAPLRKALGNAGPKRARSLCGLETQLAALNELLASTERQGCPV